MATWTTFCAMIGNSEIRLDLLEHRKATVGWIVRRSCNVFQAFRAPAVMRDVVDLQHDGHLLGIYPDDESARDAVLVAVGVTGPQLLRAI